MTFFQVLVTNWFENELNDKAYTNVFNYATIEEANNNPFWKNQESPEVEDGVTFKSLTGEEMVRFHSEGNDFKMITLEAYGYPKGCSVYQLTRTKQIIIKKVEL